MERVYEWLKEENIGRREMETRRGDEEKRIERDKRKVGGIG